MKNNILVLLGVFFLFGSADLFSQSKYGKITMEEMEMTSYSQDTTAVAVILSKEGDARFVYSDLYGFQFEYTLKMKVKILKPEGLSYCEHAIDYYELNNQNKETILGLSGMTYNLENGKIVKTKLSKEFIVDEDEDERFKIRKITMPAAKVGSVIEYKYTLKSDFFRNFRDFYFQSSIPTAYVSYDVTIPEYFKYRKSTIGYEQVKADIKDVNETFSIKVDRGLEQVRCLAERSIFVGENLPAMKDEGFLWTKEDYISKITYELQSIQFPMSMTRDYSTTWDNIDKELRERDRFGGELKKKGMFKDDITPSDITLERAREIQNFVKGKVKWNDKTSQYARNLKDALKNGIGSSAEVNFLLINALKAGNFDAFPVVMSTRSNGRLPIGRPSATAFNYVITAVRIDTTIYYTDAASEYGDWNILPQRVMVSQARIVEDKWADWVDLSSFTSGRTVLMGEISITDNAIEKKITEAYRGASAYDLRNYYYKSHKDQNEYIEKLANSQNGEIENFEITDIDKTDADVKVTYLLKQDTGLDDIIYINPMLLTHYKENPFKLEERKYPINFPYKSNYSQIVRVKIPEGYAIEELPQSEKIIFGDNNDLSFTYRIAVTGNDVSVQYQYVVNTLLVLPDAYADLRDFFSKIVQKNSAQIVLKKIAD